ncbi:MAG: dienelactone hydrolase family protein [Acidobacteriota bacterium]|nr:dienelactone hydrolase family protein [Acidobacteriota bacterium]
MESRLTGYPAATGPIASGTIVTDAEGLDVGEITIRSRNFDMPAYYARPAASASPSAVLVVQEIFGVHEHIRDICRRLAKKGCFAIAPELYARQGNVAAMTDMQEIIEKVVSKVPDEQVLADLDSTVEYMQASGKADIEKLGIVGFCWGGRIVWLYSAHEPRLKAGAAWYGKLITGPYSTPAMQPAQPADVASELHGAILGLYGGKDEGIPLSTVEQMRANLKAAGKDKRCEIVVYPDAGHAFFADYRPSYHQHSALDAWARMLAWFETNGLL